MTSSRQIIVIGAGISGLACALRLHQLRLPVMLLEDSDRVGGLANSIHKDGCLFESGPQSFQGTEAIFDVMRQVGIEGEVQRADPKAPRYVLQRGRLQRIPMSPTALLASSLLGAGARWKIVSEPFRRARAPNAEESVADFVRRKFGHEILEYLVAPFVSGVYAGDPEKLSLRAAFPTLEEWEREYGSVLRGAMKSRPLEGKRVGPPPLCSFRGGVETLPRAIGERLRESLRLRARAIAVKRQGQSGAESYEVRFSFEGREESVLGQAVVLATPAYTASHLVEHISTPLAHALSGIAYAPVAVVASAYHEKQVGVALDGFGFLVPRSERIRTLGTVWNSSLFPGRAPAGMVVMTSFIGGATDIEIAEKKEQDIAAIVQEENARLLEISGQPVSSAVWRHAKALPQYNLGHGHIVEAIRDGERGNPGLFFSGNYLEGPSLGKCIEQGTQTADAVRDYLQAPH